MTGLFNGLSRKNGAQGRKRTRAIKNPRNPVFFPAGSGSQCTTVAYRLNSHFVATLYLRLEASSH